MTEFWETKIKYEKTMWGFEPSYSAILTKDFFLANNVKDILIPGVGHSRNAKFSLIMELYQLQFHITDK